MAIDGFRTLDFERYHRDELPELIAGRRGAMAAACAASHEALALRLPDGAAFTYVPTDGGVAIVPGDAKATTVMELDAPTWEGLVHDYESAPGILYAGRGRCLRGDALRFVGWEPALRALYTGRPVYDPAAPLLDRRGDPLDPAQAFHPDDDPEELAHFLRTAGYLLLREVFSPVEVARFLDDARALAAEAVKGDKLSWWAKDAEGAEVLCRVTRAADGPHLATLRADPRIERLAGLADQPLERRSGEGNGVTVIYKNPGIREGLSDLPWHRDCGMGGHALMCPVLIASVFLTPANPETGELRFLPGSWRATCGFREATDRRGPQGVGFDARPGDVSIHYGDVMHAAPPPARSGPGVYRISATTGFSRPGARNHRGDSSYNQVLHRRDDGQIEHLAAVAERSRPR